jgi:hypothetical protein
MTSTEVRLVRAKANAEAVLAGTPALFKMRYVLVREFQWRA